MSNRDWNIALACALVAVAVIGACERRSYWREQAAKPAKPSKMPAMTPGHIRRGSSVSMADTGTTSSVVLPQWGQGMD